jgi:hypothetical protein
VRGHLNHQDRAQQKLLKTVWWRLPHTHRSTKLNGDIQREEPVPLKASDPDSSFSAYEFSTLFSMHHLALGTKILSCLASAYQPGPADEFKSSLSELAGAESPDRDRPLWGVHADVALVEHSTSSFGSMRAIACSQQLSRDPLVRQEKPDSWLGALLRFQRASSWAYRYKTKLPNRG